MSNQRNEYKKSMFIQLNKLNKVEAISFISRISTIIESALALSPALLRFFYAFDETTDKNGVPKAEDEITASNFAWIMSNLKALSDTSILFLKLEGDNFAFNTSNDPKTIDQIIIPTKRNNENKELDKPKAKNYSNTRYTYTIQELYLVKAANQALQGVVNNDK